MERRSIQLLDVLEQLRFIDEDILRGLYTNYRQKKEAYEQIKISLAHQLANIMIAQNGEMQSHGHEPEISTNLFKILCAIMNIKPN